MQTVMLVFGTRPEAIKMCPLVKEFQRRPEEFNTVVCVTGQHREMLDQVLDIFDVRPDFDLNIMRQGQDLTDVTARVLTGLRDVFKECRPDVVLVHGDTTTSTAGALAAFYAQIPVGHVEAGLRTHNIYSPWPEEMNRQITGHRRENFGDGFIRMVTAMKDLSEKYPDVDFVYPMHLNPNVRKPIHEVFGEDLTRPNFFFIEPLQYLEFVHLMSKATIVLTDSGGIQEEAPGLGKPVLVMRDTTERPEALASGTVHLVGTDYDKIVNEVSTLLDDACAYEKMSKAVNPYGDGQACRRIADILSGKETDRYDVELNK